MRQRHERDLRHARLHVFFQIAIALLLGLSFLTGLLLWWGDSIRQEEMRSPAWMHPARIVHGLLYPFLCVLFGFLLGQHIRRGWRIQANRATGLVVELLMIVQILSGVGLYYFGSEQWRAGCLWTHRISGVLLPLALMGHWIQARYWIKRCATPPSSP